MKSAILTLLPLASIALAESACELKTVTTTKYEYESVTVTPVAIKHNATPKPSTCSRRTITTTEVERVTVTVDAGGEPTEDVTSTSTTHITTTITVRPTLGPSAASSSLHWGNFPNATYHSSGAAVKPTSALPEFSVIYTPTPAGEAAAPTYPADTKPTVPSSETPSESPSTPDTPSPPSDAEPSDADTSAAGSKRGEATFYGGNTSGGMCSFTGYTIPAGVYGTALSDSNWGGASACGQCVSVTGPDGNKITAMVTDQCPGCGSNHLDLYPDAFKKLADPSKGIIKVSWDFVPCGISSPLVLKNKEGTSKHWFSMQVMNANVGISKLEVSIDGGNSWKGTNRQPYNFFENSAGFGADSVDIKVTAENGKSVVVKGVSVQAGKLTTGSGNF